jgi:type II secretory ATPase GspE/PulE/Tfp pilus assembly ATPase PilB-like protein
LRSILRHDPDVVLVGEIRDQETAQIAVQHHSLGTWCFRPCTRTMRPER